MEKIACTEAANAITEFFIAWHASRRFRLYFRSHQLIDKLNQSQKSQKERTDADTTNILFAITCWCLSVRLRCLVVPTASSSSDQKIASIDQEESRPKQVKDMNSSYNHNISWDIKVLEGVLVSASTRCSKWVEPKSLEDPNSQESNHDYK